MRNNVLAALLILLILCVGTLIVLEVRPGHEVDFFGTVTSITSDDDGNLLLEAEQSGTESVFKIKLADDMRVRGVVDEGWTAQDIAVGDLIEVEFKRAKQGEYYIPRWLLRLPVSE